MKTMTKRILASFAVLLLLGCGTTKKTGTSDKPLYEILTQQENGGGNIRFFEILTEEKEITMLQSDRKLKTKVTSADVSTSNFIILNMGEKTSGGYSIDVESVEETPKKIIVTVKDNVPAAGSMVTQAITYPYTIVKINSKKEIEIRDGK
jgi:hypothetical protein